MAGSVVARAWVQILPEMDGIQSEVSDELKGVDKQTSSAGKSSGSGFASAFKGAVGAIGGLIAAAGINELVQGAAEAQSQMSRLNASAQQNSVGAESMQATYSGLVGVLGDTDRAVETSGNLFALCGDNQAQLESLTTSLTGAFSQFGDGLPIESLAEAANETARTGTVVGGMADALNWVNASTDQWSAALSGNSAAQAAFNAAVDSGATKEDAFNAALAACSDEGERQQLVVDTLNALYGDAGEQYQQNNADLIAYNQSQDALSSSMADLGGALMPVVTTLTDMASEVAGALTPAVSTLATWITSGLNAAMVVLKPILDGVVAALGFLGQNMNIVLPILTALVGGFIAWQAALGISALIQMVTTALNGMSVAQAAATVAQNLLNAAMNANPLLMIVTLIGTVIGALIGLYNTNEEFRNGVNAAWESIRTTAESVFGPIVTFFTVTVPIAIQTAQEWFANLPGNIKGALDQAISNIQEWAAGVRDQAIKAGQNFLDGIRQKFDEAVEFVRGIPGRLVSAIGNLGGRLIESGRSLIDGLTQGIRDGFNAAVGAVQDGLAWLRGFFPFSPAKYGPFSGHGYTTYSGKALMEDWGLGIESETGAVVDYAAEAAAKVRSALSATPTATGSLLVIDDDDSPDGESDRDLLRSIDEGIDLIARMLPAALDPATRARFARGAVTYAY
jgi:hypothetical protein